MGRYREVELDDLELTGERLLLRRWQPGDAGRVQAIMRDPSMTDYLALPSPYTAQDAREFVTEFGHEGRGAGTGLGSAVVERGAGRLVGACVLRLSGDPEIGFWIAPDARGLRYAREATAVLAQFAFERLALPRVRLVCDVRNVASARSAMGAGFRFEGVGRHGVLGGGRNGVPVRHADLARFARLASDPPGPVAPAFAPLPDGGLSDGVLRLRPLRPEDAPAYLAAEDAEATRWGFTGEAMSADDAKTVTRRAGLDWLTGPAARFALEDIESGRFAGELMVRRSGPPQVGGIGYTVHPDFRGRGYTARALRLLAPWAFEQAGFARLELGAKAGNIASQKAALAGGFAHEAVRRGRLRDPDGTFSDEICFARFAGGQVIRMSP
ncbi:GNAT family N-acetyltransferase [uncultured Jatrophihabitans sp.]|uniref:GNAT family N-acetyltransferase n=1 Tax=uncultured Jatrophihabitans sp. TaxID=1610747 RepID=UPI0035C9A37D